MVDYFHRTGGVLPNAQGTKANHLLSRVGELNLAEGRISITFEIRLKQRKTELSTFIGTPSPRMVTVFLESPFISNITSSQNLVSSLGQNSTKASASPSGERTWDSNCTDSDGWFVKRQFTLHVWEIRR